MFSPFSASDPGTLKRLVSSRPTSDVAQAPNAISTSQPIWTARRCATTSRVQRTIPLLGTARCARLPEPAAGHEAVGQQEEGLVRGRAKAALGVGRVVVAVQPAGVLAHFEADQLGLVAVRSE